jgi:hypothetical protein
MEMTLPFTKTAVMEVLTRKTTIVAFNPPMEMTTFNPVMKRNNINKFYIAA